jgi:hypothetical protein
MYGLCDGVISPGEQHQLATTRAERIIFATSDGDGFIGAMYWKEDGGDEQLRGEERILR